MNKALVATVLMLSIGGIARANVFDLGGGYTNLQTVTVGDPGNAGELSGAGADGYGPDKICGSVSYAYKIGKYEVTTKQYCDFLSNKATCNGDPYGLYNSAMGDPYGSKGCNIQRTGSGTAASPYVYTVASDWANRPVNYVSFWDCCRFVNWLCNEQGNGDTENGAYSLNGYNGIDGRTVQRNSGWAWAMASEDEWYKAAYYKGGESNAGYWDYPTQSDILPSNVGSDDFTDPGNHANFYQNGCTIGGPYYQTNVGEFEKSASSYGTFDQGGNVWEWNETIIYQNSALRGMRGGGAIHNDGYGNYYNLRASNRFEAYDPSDQGAADVGFRVVQAVPEPSSALALIAGFVGIARLTARQKRGTGRPRPRGNKG